MAIVEISGRNYEATDCDACSGTGKRLDPTDADKVNAGPYVGRCATCSGKGVRYALIPAAEVLAAEARLRAALHESFDSDPNADLPDWMM